MYGRQIDGEVTSFGTTGYTYNNVFLLYDRDSRTVWYPLGDGALTGVGGARQGEEIPFIEKPQRMTLGQWRQLHPSTKVLLRDGPGSPAPVVPNDSGPAPPP